LIRARKAELLHTLPSLAAVLDFSADPASGRLGGAALRPGKLLSCL
jgi:hypothetical protein